MNNIRQKNTILSSITNTAIPYGNYKSLTYQSGQSITTPLINNTFRQLIDNDLYVQAKLNEYQIKKIGPGPADIESIRNGPNGYKYWTKDSNGVAIYRKIDDDLNGSITKILDKKSYYIFQIGDYTYSGTDEGLIRSYDMETWETVFDKKTKCYILFEDTIYIGAQDSIYKMVEQYEGPPEFVNILVEDINGCNSIIIDSNLKIAVGTDDSFLLGNFEYYLRLGRPISLQEYPKYDVDMRINKDPVNSIIQNGDDILAAQKGGIYRTEKQYIDINPISFFEDSLVQISGTIQCTQEFGGGLAIGTSNSLYYTSDPYKGGLVQLGFPEEIENVSINCFCEIGTFLYIGTDAGLFKMEKFLAPIEYDYSTEYTDITKIRNFRFSGKDIRVFCSKNKLVQFKDIGQFTVLLQFDINIRDFEVSRNGRDIFITTEDGKTYLYRIYGYDIKERDKIRYIQEKTELNGFKNVIQVNDNAYCHNTNSIVCLNDNTVIRTTFNIQSIDSNLSDMFIHSSSNQVYRWDGSSPQTERVETLDNFYKIARNGNIVVMCKYADGENTIYVNEDQSVQVVESHKVGTVDHKVTDIKIINDVIYFLDENNVLYSISKKNNSIEKVRQDDNIIFAESSNLKLNNNLVLMIGTDTELYSCSPKEIKDNRVEFYPKNSIFEGDIKSIYSEIDNTDQLYVCGDEGINRVTVESDNIVNEKVLENQSVNDMMIQDDGNIIVATDDGALLMNNSFENFGLSVRDSRTENIKINNVQDYEIFDSAISVKRGEDSRYIYGYDDNGSIYRQRLLTTNKENVYTSPSFKLSSINIIDDCIFAFGETKYVHIRNIKYRKGDKTYKNPISEVFTLGFNPSRIIQQDIMEDVSSSIKCGYCFNDNKLYSIKHKSDGTNNEYPDIREEFAFSEGLRIEDIGTMDAYNNEISNYEHILFLKVGRQLHVLDVKSDATITDRGLKINIPENIDADDIDKITCGYSEIQNNESGDRLNCNINICLKESKKIVILSYAQNDDNQMVLESQSTLISDYQESMYMKGDYKYIPLFVRKDTKYYIINNKTVDIIENDILSNTSSIKYYRDIYQKNNPDEREEDRNIDGYIISKSNSITLLRIQRGNKYILFEGHINKILKIYDNIVILKNDGSIYYTKDKNYIDINQPQKVNWTGFINSDIIDIRTNKKGEIFILKYDEKGYTSITVDDSFNVINKQYINVKNTVYGIFFNNHEQTSEFQGKMFSLMDEYLKINNRIYDVFSRIYENEYYLSYHIDGEKKYQIDDSNIQNVNCIVENRDSVLYSCHNGIFEIVNGNTPIQFSINGTTIDFGVNKFFYKFPVKEDNDLDFILTKEDGKTYSWYTIENGNKEIYEIQDIINPKDFAYVNNKLLSLNTEGKAYLLIFGEDAMPIIGKEAKLLENETIVKICKDIENIYFIADKGYTYYIYRYVGVQSPEQARVYFKVVDRYGEKIEVDSVDGFLQAHNSNKQLILKEDVVYWRRNNGIFGELNTFLESINGIGEFKGRYLIYNGSTLFSFEDSKNTDMLAQIESSKGSQTYNILFHDGKYVFSGSTNGIYRIANDIVFRISTPGYYGNCRFINTVQGKYMVSIGSNVYQSDNIRNLGYPMFTFGLGKVVNYVFKVNDKEYLFSLDDGIYRTNYSYHVVNDIKKFDETDAFKLYEDMTPNIDNIYQSNNNIHLTKYHGQGNLIDYVYNNVMDVNFSNIGNWTESEVGQNRIYVNNDIVYSIYSGDNTDNDIIVDTYNATPGLSALNQKQAKFNYIMKRWKSGFVELFINIPSTNTYYLPFNKGVPGSNIDETEVLQRKNFTNIAGISNSQKLQDSQISSHYTTIDLKVLSSFIFIEDVHDVHINGSSLPLGIYKVDQYSIGESKNMYRSFIEPSLVGEYDTSITENDYYNFKFYCFGTDQQSIRITMFDTMHMIGQTSYIVKFDPNGGQGEMKEQIFQIGKAQSLIKNKFTYTMNGIIMTFRGWSLEKQSINTDPMFNDAQLFSDEIAGITIKPGDTVILYAVWLSYKFGDGDTTFIIDSNQTDFEINKVGIIENTNLGNRIMIDYGD